MSERTSVITALGLTASLGHDLVTAAAAARAGLSRAAPLSVWIENLQTLDPEPVVGHPVDGLAEGFEGTGRLLRLAELGLLDLLRTADAEALRASHWLLALPETLPATPPPALSDADASPAPVPDPMPPRLDPERVRALIERVTGRAVAPQRFTAFVGRVGWVRAMGHAARLAEQGQACVVGAVDSLVDPAMLRGLNTHARLLTAGAAVGLQPGEAAVFALVRPARDGPGLARLGDGALGHEPDHLYSGRPALGRGLAQTVAGLPRPAGDIWPVADCNGEPFRSADWGHAVVRDDTLRASVGHTLYPATSVGDTGAASAAVGLAFVAHAFARGYAPAPTAWLLASDATAPRGVLTVSAP